MRSNVGVVAKRSIFRAAQWLGSGSASSVTGSTPGGGDGKKYRCETCDEMFFRSEVMMQAIAMDPLGFDEDPLSEPAVTPKKRKCKSVECDASSIKRRRVTREEKAAEGDIEQKHIKECKSAQCLRCKYIRNRKSWNAKLPCIQPEWDIKECDLDVQRLAAAKQSWLQPGPISLESGFTLMCVPCKFIFTAESANEAQICNFKRHHASEDHVAKVKAFLGAEFGPSGLPTAGAPSAAMFREAWDAASKGQALYQGAAGVDRKKLCRLWFCLFEALNRKDRKFLHSSVVALSRDERQHKLLIRFSACNNSLDIRRGVLWQIQKCPGSGEALTNATTDALIKFGTPMHGAPPLQSGKDVRPELVDTELVSHIVAATEVMKVDSASNEVWSCNQMKRPGSIEVNGKKMNFKHMVIARDKAHGSRRTRF